MEEAMHGRDIRAAEFRRDINGLRALAVAAVALYHFGVPGFRGGFVGVDVFFVISGYLMSGIVVRGLERNGFSLWGFYLARARRILPALIAMCAAVLGLGWFILFAPDYKTLSTHVAYSLAFLSNVEYWQEAGYFDVASHEKWLLHTWSLSVEWQFYLLLPLVMMLAWRCWPGRRALIWVSACGLLASLLACVLMTASSPTTAFYLLPYRAWEMLAGGLLALLEPRLARAGAARPMLAVPGLVLIIGSIVWFETASAWPGWRAIVPVLGAMLVIAARAESRWSDNRFAQWIGERSYSIYLWHWPVCVALAYLEGQDNALATGVGIALALGLGHVSFVGIESRSRIFLSASRRRTALMLLAGSTAAVALPAVALWQHNGFGGRFASAVELAAAESYNSNPRRGECHPSTGSTSPLCVYGSQPARVLVVGDSHADAVVTAVAVAQPQGAGVMQLTYSGCPFIPGLKQLPEHLARFKAGYQCAGFIEWTRRKLDELPAELPVIIVGRYAEGAYGGNEARAEQRRPEVYFSRIYTRAEPEFLAEFGRAITTTACELARRRPVYLVRPIPEIGVDVPKALSRRGIFGHSEDISVSEAEYRARNGWIWQAQDAAREQCGVVILDPTAYLCRAGRCYGSLKGRPLYYDDDHLSEYGNKLLVPMFQRAFQEM